MVGNLLLRRTLLGLLTLFLVSILVFFATQVLPGNAATAVLGQSATPSRVDVLEEQLDLNRPVFEQYVSWLGGLVTGSDG